MNFATYEMLILRLTNLIKQNKKLTVLTGSGLTLANIDSSEPGVSSSGDITNEIKDVFRKHNASDLFEKALNNLTTDSDRYQAAMQVLLSCFGQDELNNVITRAVLNAMTDMTVINSPELNLDVLEKEYNNWHLRNGVDALGELFVDYNELFGGPLLTSNFDPLLEISIRKHNGNPQSTFLVNDGKFLNQKNDQTHSVVHIHGYWQGGDTLHTIDQLKRERPR